MDDHEQSGSEPRKRKAAGQSSGAGPDRKTRIASKRKELQRWEEGTGEEKSKWIQRELDQMFASGDAGRPGAGSDSSPSAGGGRFGKEPRSFDLPRSTGRRDSGDGGYQPRSRRDGDSGFAPRGRRDGDSNYGPRPQRDGDSDYRPRPQRDGDSGFAPRGRRDGDSDYRPRPPRDGDSGYQPRARRDGDSGFAPRGRRDGASDYRPRPPRDGDSGFAPRGRRDGASDYRPRPPRDGDSGFAPRGRRDGASDYRPRPPRDGDSGSAPRGRRDGDSGYQPRGRRDNDAPYGTRREYSEKPKRATDKIRIPKTSEHPIRGKAPKSIAFDTPMRLNRFVANTGLCSRRRADELIEGGHIMVDGEVINVLGSRVSPGSVVTYQGTTLRLQNLVYVLLNKPKDYITTTEDPEDRKTVMSLVEEASQERILPVGRLDRNTTGLLLMTNDGELAQKLTHPSFQISKVYDVGLDKPLTRSDFEKIAAGITLEDGLAEIDTIAYPNPDDLTQVGIELHIGRNRIVRRIFESLGYDVIRLDRVVYAGLTKKDLPRGQWRYLTPREVSRLLKN